MNSRRISVAFSALVIAALACTVGQAAPAKQDLPATITAQALTLQAPSGTPAPPTPTGTPVATNTSTVPQVSVSSATNCRTGPSTAYVLLYTMQPGQFAEVVGKHTPSGYWIIKYPNGECWLWGQYATVSGNISVLPEYAQPPTPTPAEPAAPKNFKAVAACSPGGGLLQVNVHVSLTWSDQATNEEGYHIYRDDTLLATLPANATSFEDDTTHLILFLIGTPTAPWSDTYAIEAFNGAGHSNRKEQTVDCS
jgi:hypothetical protein